MIFDTSCDNCDNSCDNVSKREIFVSVHITILINQCNTDTNFITMCTCNLKIYQLLQGVKCIITSKKVGVRYISIWLTHIFQVLHSIVIGRQMSCNL